MPHLLRGTASHPASIRHKQACFWLISTLLMVYLIVISMIDNTIYYYYFELIDWYFVDAMMSLIPGNHGNIVEPSSYF